MSPTLDGNGGQLVSLANVVYYCTAAAHDVRDRVLSYICYAWP